MKKTTIANNLSRAKMLILSLTVISFLCIAVASLTQSASGARESLSSISDATRQFAVSDPMGKVESEVLEDLAIDGEATFFLLLGEKANLTAAAGFAKRAERTGFVYENLTSTAEKSQAALRALLEARGIPYQSFWIINAIQVTGDRLLLEELASQPEVEQVMAHRNYKLPELKRGADDLRMTELGATSMEWGINNIQAPLVWSTFGVRGEGIVVANIDTGVRFNHPALAAQYRGNQNGVIDHNYNWRDFSAVCPGAVPCDNTGNGTFTMGIMVGDDGGSNQIGVAPAARWMACKGCASNSCSTSALLACGQWIVAPTDLNGANPRPDLAPHIVNNSWNTGGGNSFYQTVVNNWVAAGIFPVFANGNSGPGCNTASSPADYINSYSAGAYDINNNIASFSGRGASTFGGEIKPNIAAPGVNIRSSSTSSLYATLSGTAAASPHLAGVVALIWSAAPSLRGNVADTRFLLDNTAIDVASLSCGGTADDNNVFGEGRLNAFSAVDQAPRLARGTLTGTVTDADTNAPLSGVTVQAVGPDDRITMTDADGVYSFFLAVGSYDVTASSLGYASETAMGVLVTEGGTTTQDFALNAQAVIDAGPATLVSESCPPANGAVDPGERVTVNLELMNTSDAATSNLVAALQSSGVVLAPSGPQSYGAIAVNSSAARDFSFTVPGNVSSGQTITATLQLQDGAINLGTVSFNFNAGPSPCAFVRLVVTSSLSRANASTVVGGITVQNIGSLAANNVTLTTARLGATNGTPLPQGLGNLAPGDSANVMMNFNNSTPGVSSMLTVGGTYSGGSFSSSKRVTIPTCSPGAPGCGWQAGDMVSYSQDSWGGDLAMNTAAGILAAYFNTIYGGGVEVGTSGNTRKILTVRLPKQRASKS